MSDTTTLTPVDIDQRLTDLTQQVAELQVMVLAAIDHLPTATAQKMWEKREGVFRIVGAMLDVPTERVDKVLDTKCITSWEERILPPMY